MNAAHAAQCRGARALSPIVEIATLEEALEWTRKGARIGRNNVEVHEIFFDPAPKEN